MQGHIKAFRAVSIISLFSIGNFILTVIIQIVLAAVFGARIEMDAYLLAITLPIVAVSLFTNTSEVVFVPFFKKIELTGCETDIKKIEGVIFNFFLLILSIIVVSGIISAPQIIQCLASGFSPRAKELSLVLFRITVPSILFAGLSGFMVSIYYAREKFTRPASISLLNNLVLILVFFVLYPFLKINALAWGMLFGSMAQFLFLFFPLFRGRKHFFGLSLKNPALYKTGYKFLQILIGAGIFGLIIPFERFLASGLPEGNISYLGYARRIVTILLLLPSTVIPIVLLPNLSRHFAVQNLDKLRKNLALGIRLVFFAMLPICVLLFIFRMPLIYVFLERGNFDSVATNGVGQALVCYLGVLLGAGLAAIVGRGFFAIQNTFIPALIMAGTFLFYVLIAIPLTGLFSFRGLAVSLSITVLAGLLVDLLVLRRLLNGIEGRLIFATIYKVIVSSIVMGIIAWFVCQKMVLDLAAGDKLIVFLKLGISVLISLIVYALFCLALKLEEVSFVYNIVFARLNRKR